VRTDPVDDSGSEGVLPGQIAIARLGFDDGEGDEAGLRVVFPDENQRDPVRVRVET
jgi:hypothetical protein